MSERMSLEMLGYFALWALFTALFISMGHLKCGAKISIQFVLDCCFCFFLTTVPGFRSYHHIPAEYLVLLPIQKMGCTGSASLEFWAFFCTDKTNQRCPFITKMPAL